MIKGLVRRALKKSLGLEAYGAEDPNLLAYTITARTTRRLIHFYDLLSQVKGSTLADRT